MQASTPAPAPDPAAASLEQAHAFGAVARAVDVLRDAGLDYWLTVDMPSGSAYQSWKPNGRHDWKLGTT